MAKKKSGASSAGFHFYNLYQCCPRKFFIRWVCRIDTKHLPKALIYGAAFHEAKAEYYRTGDRTKATKKGLAYLTANKKEYEFQEDFQENTFRLPIALNKWVQTYGIDDLSMYDPIFIEEEMEVNLHGFRFTGRPDTVLKGKKSGKIYVMETKTSGFSKDVTLNAVYFGDQATAYFMLMKDKIGKVPDGLIPDVLYWNSKSNSSSSTPEAVRGSVVKRTEEDIHHFRLGIMQVFSEIAQKVEAVKQGADPFQLFPRNGYYCTSYGKPCEFADICRMNLKAGMKAPSGYRIDKQDVELTTETNDIIGGL